MALEQLTGVTLPAVPVRRGSTRAFVDLQLPPVVSAALHAATWLRSQGHSACCSACVLRIIIILCVCSIPQMHRHALNTFLDLVQAYYMDGITDDKLKHLSQHLRVPGDWAPIVGDSGRTWGAVSRTR